jgi:hypothetical protein
LKKKKPLTEEQKDRQREYMAAYYQRHKGEKKPVEPVEPIPIPEHETPEEKIARWDAVIEAWHQREIARRVNGKTVAAERARAARLKKKEKRNGKLATKGRGSLTSLYPPFMICQGAHVVQDVLQSTRKTPGTTQAEGVRWWKKPEH